MQVQNAPNPSWVSAFDQSIIGAKVINGYFRHKQLRIPIYGNNNYFIIDMIKHNVPQDRSAVWRTVE